MPEIERLSIRKNGKEIGRDSLLENDRYKDQENDRASWTVSNIVWLIKRSFNVISARHAAPLRQRGIACRAGPLELKNDFQIKKKS